MGGHFKHKPVIGWSDRDLIWLKAAVQLPAYDFLLAIEDISSMSGRTLGAVAQKAKAMRREKFAARTSRKVPLPQTPAQPPRNKRMRQKLIDRAALVRLG